MKKFLKNLTLGVTAGICIGIGTITYLLITNKLLGAFVFAFGLFLVCTYELKLCTGMAGYLFSDKNTNGFIAAAMGNVVGMSFMFCLAKLCNENIILAARKVFNTKLTMLPHQLFVSALFCGMLMFIAVDIYKFSAEDSMLQRLSGIFLAVPCFILNSFDHCVVTVFYIFTASTIIEVLQGLHIFAIVMIGNFVGAIIANILFDKVHRWRV